jgi:hypothetical protein
MNYGKLPDVLGFYELHPKEVFYYLYLPISLAGSNDIVLPKQLECFLDIVKAIQKNEPKRFKDEYVYITAKRMFVGGGVTANRPGWHSDGFMTDDLNYVWYDCVPTIFNNSMFNISQDHSLSLKEFEAQALPENNKTYHPGQLLKLDQSVVHAVAEAKEQQMRTFVKISISPDKYNLSDNSHNYELNYSWKMFDRAAVRNNPASAQKDSAPVQDDHLV